MPRIGVFVCWCGENIARTVDCPGTVEALKGTRDVEYVIDYKYMCSSPGQNLIADAIREYKLDGVVVASCSPRMHLPTFMGAAEAAGLNPYLVEMANIREQCSWAHHDKPEATRKAIELIKMKIARMAPTYPLDKIEIPVTRRGLVLGGGVAGIQAALDLADAGIETVLVEREPSIGGHMSQLDETFPTLDCSQCILTPKMVDVSRNKLIKLHTYSEIASLEGYVGNFRVGIRKKARSVNMELCTGCATCMEKCPTKVESEFNVGLGTRKAIYVPFPQAVPNVPVIDREHCRYFLKGKCRVCEKVCSPKAVDFEQKDEIVYEDVGAIIVATGYDLMPKDTYGEYGYGRYKDIIDGLEFERMASASGPTGGKIVRPSDGKEPKNVVFINCVGSRDDRQGIEYCSKICCMYSAKHTILLKHKIHDAQPFVFYMDIRAAGKGYEEFIRRAMDKEGAIYLRGRVSKIYQQGEKLIVKGADTLTSSQVEIAADLVVLSTAIKPAKGAADLARILGIPVDKDSFYSEAHPKLRPVETTTAGIFLAGCCHGPKDIPDSVSQASAAAAKALGLFSKDKIEREPHVAKVDESICSGCFACESVCPFSAIKRKEIRDRKGNLIKIVAEINKGLCLGCGTCAATCRPGCITLEGFSDEQLYEELMAL